MKIFLTVTAVILGILLLLFLLIFFLTVKLCFEYDTDTGKISLYIKALFIKYTVLPQDPAKARKKALKKQKKKGLTGAEDKRYQVESATPYPEKFFAVSGATQCGK